MDPLYESFLKSYVQNGLFSGDTFTQPLTLPQDVDCLWYGEDSGVVPVTPEMADLLAEDSDFLRKCVESAIDGFDFGEKNDEDFDPYDMSYEDLIAQFPGIGDEMLKHYSQSHEWEYRIVDDLAQMGRRYVWPINLECNLTGREAEEVASLVHRQTGGYVRLCWMEGLHKPPDMRGRYCFVMTDAGSHALSLELACAYICAQKYPPLRLLGQDLLEQLKYDRLGPGAIIEWLAVESLCEVGRILRMNANYLDDTVKSIEAWIDTIQGPPVLGDSHRGRTAHENALELQKARATLALQGVVLKYGSTDD